MARIGDLDISDRLLPIVPRWVTQIAVGALCALGVGVIRAGFDLIVKGAAPFALVFPAIILATLFARWFAGAVTAVIAIVYAWFYVYNVQLNGPTAGNAPLLSLGVVTVAAVFTIVIAELFRAAARRATLERDREIADRDLFLEEFDHRVKNNFAIVAGMLDMQKRRATDPATIEALATAQLRVGSIARAHLHLYRGTGQPGMVEMRDYLGDLCAALAEALFPRGGIVLNCDVAEAAMPRDRAVSIGLVVNELVTNAAKHAFPARNDGQISVLFGDKPGGGWRVAVTDDGIGMAEAPAATGGLGGRLTEAFARQAGGTLAIDSDRTGTRVTLDLAS